MNRAVSFQILVLVGCLALVVYAGSLTWTCPNCGRTFRFDPRHSSHMSSFIQQHQRVCRPRRQGGGSSSCGGYRGSSAGGEALGRALGGLLERLFEGMAEQQRRAAAMAAQRRRQQAIARERARRRQEQLRRARLRLAAMLREDWDRRDAETSQRLAGVFDVPMDTSVVDLRPGGTPFFGSGGSGAFVDTSVVDLRPEPSEQRELESRLRSGPWGPRAAPLPGHPALWSGTVDPRFLREQARRAAATDAFAEWNYGSSPAALEPAAADRFVVPERLRSLFGEMKNDVVGEVLGARWSAAGNMRTYYLAMMELKGEVAGLLSPSLVPAAVHSRGIGKFLAVPDRAGLNFERNLSGDRAKQYETYRGKLRGLLTGVKHDARLLRRRYLTAGD